MFGVAGPGRKRVTRMSGITGEVRTETTVAPKLPVRREVGAIVSCRDLLREMEARPEVLASGKIRFALVGENDVYNISAPFRFDGQLLIAGRVESRDSENSTTVLFRRELDDVWTPCPASPTYPALQDPCTTMVDGELVLGGVRFPIKLSNGHTGWQMEFYRGKSLSTMRRFLVGPEHMKDIRLAALGDGRIAVFSRPQGKLGGRGKIGFTIADSLDAITAEMIATAPLFPSQFLDTEWGAANEVHLLRNGKLGVLGHIACSDEKNHRHYYAMAFSVDPQTRTAGPIQIIAQRSMFPAGPSKRLDLVDVIFSGGMLRHWDGTATLFCGMSDAEAGYITIRDPMVDFED